MSIYVEMKKTLIDYLLEKRFNGDLSVDDSLRRLSSDEEEIWMNELFPNRNNIQKSALYKQMHGYNIKAFAHFFFSELCDSEEQASLERKAFLNLSKEAQIEFLDEHLKDDMIKEQHIIKKVLKDFLKQNLTREVVEIVKFILSEEDVLKKTQIVFDASYFDDVIVVNQNCVDILDRNDLPLSRKKDILKNKRKISLKMNNQRKKSYI